MNMQARPYRQNARAIAAARTADRILDSFVGRLASQWLDEIRLDDIAADAGVTVQTVIRRFGGKEGLLEAAADRLQSEIDCRRRVEPGEFRPAIRALADDYEKAGDLFVRILAQEDRSPDLAAMNAAGRTAHRRWIEAVFRPWLDSVEGELRRQLLDALVVAGDVYVWKLVRRDFGRSRADYEALVERMMEAALIGSSEK